MSLKLRERDYVPDGTGGFQSAEGESKVLEDALFLLTARRGGFELMPEVGSRLYLLCREKAGDREAVAKAYAQEALEAMGVFVNRVTVKEGAPMGLEVEMVYEGRIKYLEVTVQ